MTAPEAFAPVVYVDLVHTPFQASPYKGHGPDAARHQPWRWRALNGGNGKTLAVSSEAYTNRQDCIDAASQLFGSGTTVFLREAEHGNVLLRMAVRDA